MGDVIPGVPSDNTTLIEVLDAFRDAGFDGTMWVAADGKLKCDRCDTELDPESVTVHAVRRLEGASDPDDMMAVVAVECPQCGRKATFVVHFGPEASFEEQEAFAHLAMR